VVYQKFWQPTIDTPMGDVGEIEAAVAGGKHEARCHALKRSEFRAAGSTRSAATVAQKRRVCGSDPLLRDNCDSPP
jgi:hypothetical protein